MIERIITIGAYGFDERKFIDALKAAQVDLFIDIRARRGMRGSLYAFANARRLQTSLAQANIRYIHIKEMAPSELVRDAQRNADAVAGIAKRDRTSLGEAFTVAYCMQCLSSFDSKHFVEVYCRNARRPVFFCVERESVACHRSLVADRLSRDLCIPVENINS